jgi:hypothetical protein
MIIKHRQNRTVCRIVRAKNCDKALSTQKTSQTVALNEPRHVYCIYMKADKKLPSSSTEKSNNGTTQYRKDRVASDSQQTTGNDNLLKYCAKK